MPDKPVDTYLGTIETEAPQRVVLSLEAIGPTRTKNRKVTGYRVGLRYPGVLSVQEARALYHFLETTLPPEFPPNPPGT